MSTQVEQWEAGKILTAGRMKKGYSKRRAAEETGISEARWRQIENGWVKVHGKRKKISAPATTLSKAALVLDIDPLHVLNAAGIEPGGAVNPTRQEITHLLSKLTDSQLHQVLGFIHGIISR